VLQGFRGAVHYAELETTMQAAHNSSACITAGACLPLGSHSVWCAIEGMQASEPGLAVASAACVRAVVLRWRG
jgi:hypothetical protein